MSSNFQVFEFILRPSKTLRRRINSQAGILSFSKAIMPTFPDLTVNIRGQFMPHDFPDLHCYLIKIARELYKTGTEKIKVMCDFFLVEK
jgi:hypothetical protein